MTSPARFAARAAQLRDEAAEETTDSSLPVHIAFSQRKMHFRLEICLYQILLAKFFNFANVANCIKLHVSPMADRHLEYYDCGSALFGGSYIKDVMKFNNHLQRQVIAPLLG